jgi:hypothetical protein
MNRAALIISVCFICCAGSLPAAPLDSGLDRTQAKKEQTGQTPLSSLAGCVDQREDGQFVLIDDRTRSVLARLAAEGFPLEGLAKYLGQKVTVRGISSSNGTPSEFRVRSVTVISETCAAQ